MLARWIVVDENFTRRVKANDLPILASQVSLESAELTAKAVWDIYDSQVKSRHLDLIARVLKERNQSFYTIGSAGHEANAAVASAFTLQDTALLHYRSGAFFIQRGKSLALQNPVRDVLLSLVCSKADPISQGRHKVFGSVPLNIPPQTSTIASHTPKALGLAAAMTRAKKLAQQNKQLAKLLKHEGVVLCSFGDASFNHSTCQGSINAASWLKFNHYPLPIVFICEDNGIGISTPTPPEWIEMAMRHKPGFTYLQADGRDVVAVYAAAVAARRSAANGTPTFLHIKTVRLMGHAGSDIETHYWTEAQIVANEAEDPLLYTAALLINNGFKMPDALIAHYESVREEVAAYADEVISLQRLQSADEVMSSLIPPAKKQMFQINDASASALEKLSIHPLWQERKSRELTSAQLINLGLCEIMHIYPQAICFGEDVGKKGGVYRVTANLQETFGKARVFDSLLDEQTILGMAIGSAMANFLPIPEIQFLAYVHNAEDQLRGEAVTCSFFSSGQFTNPMLVRIPGFAYQKGFGGHFHNDNAFGFLREMPGLIIACPADGNKAVRLLRTCAKLVAEEQRVVIFLEPIALYHEKEVLRHWPEESQSIALGNVEVTGELRAETAIVTYGNGHLLAEKACAMTGVSVRIIDLCWLSPLPWDSLLKAIGGVKRVLIVDECRQTGSISEQIMTMIYENNQHNGKMLPTIERITAKDSFIPLGDSWQYVLPSVHEIAQRLIN